MLRQRLLNFFSASLLVVATQSVAKPQDPNYPATPPPLSTSAPDTDPSADDAQHAVGRVSIVQGEANIRRGDNGDLVAAAMNEPLLAQDRLQTAENSRAEVELDSGNVVRLAPNTDLGLPALQYRNYQLQLATGTIIYRVLRSANSQVEIDTPSIAIRPLTIGEYRISVFEDGTTQITVRSGELEINGPRGSERFGPGKTILVRGDAGDPEFQTTYEIAKDDFDLWSEDRDHRFITSQSYQYVSPDIDGADDLDAYGTWVPSQYGTVWAPRPVTPNWAPYSYGHWAWEGYYGWSWVDYAPWGWAPFHYGRWFWNAGHGWCWWPGPAYGRYHWSPALVGFFGVGGVSVNVGFGSLGWVALAPFENCHRWWGHSYYGGYYGRGGYTNINVVNVYHNARIYGSAITTNSRYFGARNQPFTRASFGQLHNVSLIRGGGGLPVAPARGGFNYANRAGFEHRQFTEAERRSFFSNPRASQYNDRAPASRTAGQGWQRFGAPGTANGFRANGFQANGFQRAPARGNANESSGWHQFGTPQRPTPQGPMNGYTGRSYNSGGRYSAPAPGYSRPMQTYPGSAYGYRGPSNFGTGHYSAPTPHYGGSSYSRPMQSYRGSTGGSQYHGGSFGGGGHSGSFGGASHSGGGGGGYRGR